MRTPSIQSIKDLGVAQLVARYLGVVEAVGSSPVTQTIKSTTSGEMISIVVLFILQIKRLCA